MSHSDRAPFAHPPGVSVAAAGPGFARTARTRLGAFASILATVTLLGSLGIWVLFPMQSRIMDRTALVYMAELGVALDAAMMFAVWGTRIPDAVILRAGFVYQGLRAITLALSPMPSEGVPLLTWADVVVVVFPILLPPVRWWTPIATTLAALAAPATLWLAVQLTGAQLERADMVLSTFVSGVALVMALLVADVVRRVSSDQHSYIASYQLVELIGEGGMGEVWSAEHRFLTRSAAIKLIPQRLETSKRSKAKVLRRFRREAQVTAQLTSPHTVQIFDYGVSDTGMYFYVMELLDGFDLQALVKKFGPLSSARAVYLVRQICDSLGEAHQRGLIHRDLKPSNLFIVRRGLHGDFVKVLDFGLVGLGDRLRTETYDGKITAAGMMTGTPAYMSPEMALGTKVDARADLYSLGCVLYYLVTGQVLYPGLSAVQMALAHAHDPTPVPSDTGVDVDPGLEQILSLLLAKDPERRPQSAEQLLRLLNRLEFTSEWTADQADQWWQENKPLPTDSMQLAVRRDVERSPFS